MISDGFAVIDLGTNTFHLLIVKAKGNSWEECYRERIFVNLAEGGISEINESALKKGLDALTHFKEIIHSHHITQVAAIGTAALRNAKNAKDFIDLVKRTIGISVRVIDGDQEAKYITQGVLQAVPETHENLLIMDIGGGSVEFVLLVNNEVTFVHSYPIGVAVLFDQFHKSDPISPSEIQKMNTFLDEQLIELNSALLGIEDVELVGASGTFEVLDKALKGRLVEHNYSDIPMDDFYAMHERVMPMKTAQREDDQSIPATRVGYIVVALQLIHYVLETYPISSIGVSGYAMKEGIVREWLDNLD